MFCWKFASLPYKSIPEIDLHGTGSSLYYHVLPIFIRTCHDTLLSSLLISIFCHKFLLIHLCFVLYYYFDLHLVLSNIFLISYFHHLPVSFVFFFFSFHIPVLFTHFFLFILCIFCFFVFATSSYSLELRRLLRPVCKFILFLACNRIKVKEERRERSHF